MTDFVGPPRWLGVDSARLGGMAVRLPLVSEFARHKTVSGTVRHYVMPDDHLTTEFLRDLFVLDTGSIITKWWGSRADAQQLAALLLRDFFD